MNTCELGKSGELRAVAWLKDKDYKILCRNFRKRGFEIDIIAICPKGILRFIEVKTIRYGSPELATYSVINRNIRRYRIGIKVFLEANRQFLYYRKSIDVIMITRESDILCFENISLNCDV
jgi:Holliday junction resolvase-like predicted endonuclease